MVKVVNQSSGISGHVKIALVGRDGRIKTRREFKNLVLDQFFTDNRSIPHGSFRIFLNNCFLSSDVTTPPSPEDTEMSNFIARQDEAEPIERGYVQGAANDGSEDYRFASRVFRFDGDTANGVLTEVGLAPSNSQTAVYFKSLIKDSNGQPAPITKQPGETLFVEYEVRMYRPADFISDPFTLPENPGSFRIIKSVMYHGLSAPQDWPAYPWGTRGSNTDVFSRYDLSPGRYDTDEFNFTPTFNGYNVNNSNLQSLGVFFPSINLEFNHTIRIEPATTERTLYPWLVSTRFFTRELADSEGITRPNLTFEYSGRASGASGTANFANSRIYCGPNFVNNIDHVALSVNTMLSIGVIVDADTLVPRTITIPPGYRFDIQVENKPSVTRR